VADERSASRELAAEVVGWRATQNAIFNSRVSRRDLLRAIGFGAVSGAILAACGSTAVTPSPAPASPAATATSAPASAPPTVAPSSATPATVAPSSAAPVTPSPAPTSQPRGGTIRAGAFEGGLVDGWLTWNAFGQQFAWNWCAQRLVSVGPDASILYEMAKSHTVSADGKTYTFTLVDGLTWHDGKPVTAADVAFTYNSALKAKAGSNSSALVTPVSGSKAVLDDNSKDCSGIQVVDDLTIRFVLDQPSAKMIPTTFATIWIMPKHPFDGVALEEYANQDVAKNLFVGSGPMRMTEFKPKEFVNFEAYDGYANGSGFKGRPAADKVSIRIYADENAQATSTKAGEVDYNYIRKPTGDQLKQYKTVQGMTVQESLVGFNICIAFNFKSSVKPLLDKRVRQALVWAIDRQTIVTDVLGVGKVPDISNQWIAPWANSPNLQTYSPQDVAKAKQLLADAGWVSTTILDVRHYPPKLTPDVPVIVEMWKAVGVNVKLTPLTDDAFVKDYYLSKGPAGQPDQGPSYDIAFVYGYGSIDGSPWVADQILASSSTWPNGYNSMRWSNPEWDKEFAAGVAAPDQASQAPHFMRCSEIFNDELPYAPLYQEVDYAIIGNTLKGPENYTILDPTGGGVRYWEWYITA
jgi:peptide/nickel transport system substrate-binding protein